MQLFRSRNSKKHISFKKQPRVMIAAFPSFKFWSFDSDSKEEFQIFFFFSLLKRQNDSKNLSAVVVLKQQHQLSIRQPENKLAAIRLGCEYCDTTRLVLACSFWRNSSTISGLDSKGNSFDHKKLPTDTISFFLVLSRFVFYPEFWFKADQEHKADSRLIRIAATQLGQINMHAQTCK